MPQAPHHVSTGSRNLQPSRFTPTTQPSRKRPLSFTLRDRLWSGSGAVSFLASQDAGFITGQRIVIDGGRSLST
jgi:hypothetical protein